MELLRNNAFILAGTLCYWDKLVSTYTKALPQASMMFLYGLANLCIIWSTLK